MKFSNSFLFKNAIWTVAGYGFGQALRLLTNVVLTRLLAPELFGIMLIVNSIRTGLDLISDVGLGQNIVQNAKAEDPDFYDTAWTLRLIRSILLWLLFAIIAVPLSHYYNVPIVAYITPIYGLFFVIAALGSVSVHLIQKQMRYRRLNAYGMAQDTFSAAFQIVIAYLFPSIWALVFGALASITFSAVTSYLIVPGLRHRFFISKLYTMEILSFGKWIYLSSIVYFLAMNFDRLYFAKIAALDVVGVYGIARSMSELVTATVMRFCSYVIFPLLASHQAEPRHKLRESLKYKRLFLIIGAALGVSILIAGGDLIVGLLYDQRYAAAGWMLPLLSLGIWFSILYNINEATLWGLGVSSYSAISNGCKFIWLLIGIPFATAHNGIEGVVVVVAASDIFRYAPMVIGQSKQKIQFVGQDLFVTCSLVLFVTVLESIRLYFGLGVSFRTFPW